jgi:hypothetical protein
VNVTSTVPEHEVRNNDILIHPNVAFAIIFHSRPSYKVPRPCHARMPYVLFVCNFGHITYVALVRMWYSGSPKVIAVLTLQWPPSSANSADSADS